MWLVRNAASRHLWSDAAQGFTQVAVLCVVFSLISLSRVFNQNDLLAAEIYPVNNMPSDTDFWLLAQTMKP